MVQATRRKLIKGAAAAVGAMAVAPQLLAQAAPVRVGYAIARTGPWTGGAQVSQEPNYLLWAEQQNAAGGLNVKGVKRQIELISSDDRSDTETVVRTYEKLMGSDKVDLVLPPWGSNANFAVAPLANRFGYPFLAPTALSRRLVEMKLPYFFLLLQQPAPMTDALVDMLKANGAKSVAVIYVDDLFGLENYSALKVALQGSGISLVQETSYPGGVKDLSPVLRSIKDKNPGCVRGLHLSARHHPGQQAGQGGRPEPEVLLRLGGHGLPALQERDDAGRRRGRAGHGLVEQQDQPRRQGLLRCPHQEVRRQGAGPLGQRRLLGRHGDPHRRGGQGRAGPQGHPRLHRGHQRTRPSWATSSSTAARTPPRRARWASGRTASSKWCGRRRWRPPS